MGASPTTLDQGRRTAGRVQTIIVLAVAVAVVAGLTWLVTERRR